MNPADKKKLAVTLSLIPCPNCGGPFYSHDFGMTNIRCRECGFEAIFHMMEGADKQLAFSIDNEDAEMLMAQHVKVPPVILYWSWQHPELKMRMEAADLYPFIPYTFLRAADTSLSLSGQSNSTLVFLQSEDQLPKMRIYNNPSDDKEIAEMVSNWQTRSTSHVQRLFDMGYGRASRIVGLANEIRRQKGLPDEVEDEDEDE
jgi:DNA-directed RNA polymerase subunit RPC12/RpoP